MSLRMHTTLRPELKPSHPKTSGQVVLPDNIGPTITVRQPLPISVELGDDIAHLVSYYDIKTLHNFANKQG